MVSVGFDPAFVIFGIAFRKGTVLMEGGSQIAALVLD